HGRDPRPHGARGRGQHGLRAVDGEGGSHSHRKHVLMHVGCTCHRLECVTALIFDGPGVKKSMALARAVTTRYTKSSQAIERLRGLCGIVGIIPLRVIQDVETRWWSTQSM
ncbi:unnamed protein product, partial [Ascophyllum nodosum]